MKTKRKIGRPATWTTKLLQIEALKFQTRKEFHTNAPGAYAAAKKKGIFETVCRHMSAPKNYGRPPAWTKETLQAEALKFQTRKEFYNGSPAAYAFALKYSLLNSVCGHMPQHASGFKAYGRGFQGDKPAILYYVKILASPVVYKLGVTNHTIEKRFRKCDLPKIEVLKTWAFKIGGNAYRAEQNILRHCKDFLHTGPAILTSGNTELFTADILAID